MAIDWLDPFVQSVGTTQSITGVASALREKNPMM